MKRPIAEILEQLNLLDEGTCVEAKRGLGKEALHTIAAFANEPGLDGGTLVFGVVGKDGHGGYEVVGVPDPDKLQSDLASQCASTFNRPLRPAIWSEAIDGRVLVAAFIDEAPAGEKPIYVKSTGVPAGAYRRIGASDVRCSDDDIRLFHTLAQEGRYEDSFALDGAMGDLDDDVIEDYRKILVEQNPDTAIKSYDRDRFVQALGGARPDGATLRPTVAGLVLFAKRAALRRLYPGLRVDYVRVNGTRWVASPMRRPRPWSTPAAPGTSPTPISATWLVWKRWTPAPSCEGCVTMACSNFGAQGRQRSGCWLERRQRDGQHRSKRHRRRQPSPRRQGSCDRKDRGSAPEKTGVPHPKRQGLPSRKDRGCPPSLCGKSPNWVSVRRQSTFGALSACFAA
jgi:hypothetical protein